MALVDTRINYFTPPLDGSKAFFYTNLTAPDGGPNKNFDNVEFPVQVENVRGREKSPELSLDVSGFEFHKSPTSVEDFGDEELVKSKYYEECVQNIKRITGASKIVIFDHTIRGRVPEGTVEGPGNRGPARAAHVDQSAAAAERRVYRHLPESEVPSLLSKRYQIINLWRPINNPAWQFPLALCDFRSVASDKEGDVVPVTLKYPDHEFVLIKCSDSKLDGSVAAFTPHTAFEDPTTPADAPYRQSIEIRALVFYDE